MKYKKRIMMLFACGAFMAAITAGASIQGKESEPFDYEMWGKALQKDYEKEDKTSVANPVDDAENGTSSDTIYAVGNSATIMQSDIEKASAFYLAKGLDSSEAKEKAIRYCEEYEALYAKASSEGYKSSDAEVKQYVADIKASIFSDETDEGTQKEFQNIIAQFDSEEDYWQYEEEIYKKQLPINQYVSDLEENFYKSNTQASETEWDTYFENVKEELVQSENYQLY